MSEAPRVLIEVAEHVAVATLNRPERHNALDGEMFDALALAAQQLARRPGVRAVVLRGEGPSFCSGIDLASLVAAGGDSPQAGLAALREPLRGPVPNRFQRAASDWLEVPVPAIAAVHGACFGGGLQVALAADIRIAAPDARLSVMEIRWGLIPDMAITRTLPRLVGIDVAKELTFTGRELSGAEAHALGLVTKLDEDPLGAARELAARIAQRSPDAIRAAKRLFDESWTGTAAETLALEAGLQAELIGAPNQLAATTAGLRGEPAEFVDPA